jgi:hypothetical protein
VEILLDETYWRNKIARSEQGERVFEGGWFASSSLRVPFPLLVFRLRAAGLAKPIWKVLCGCNPFIIITSIGVDSKALTVDANPPSIRTYKKIRIGAPIV